MATAAEGQPTAPAKKRALPFKRTVARREPSATPAPEQNEDDSDLDLFRHSKEVFPEILRESQDAEDPKSYDRKRRKVSLDRSPDPASPRRRSTTLGESDDDVIMDVKGKGKEIIRPSRRTSNPSTPTSRQSPRTAASRKSTPRNRAHSPTPGAAVISLDDSDSSEADIKPIATPLRRSTRQKSSEPFTRSHPCNTTTTSSPLEILESPASDDLEEVDPNPDDQPPDEFSEWITKARALQQQQQQQQQQPTSSNQAQSSPVVTVFITSRLPHASDRPVLVKRRLNQDVQLLLQVWVSEQIRHGIAVPDDVAAGLFLTWKGNKIYGVSTLASLGVRVDERGVVKKGVVGDSEGGYFRGGLHLEVWTEEAYVEYLESRGKKRAMKLGALGAEGGMDGDDDVMGGEGGSDPEEEVQLVEQQKRKGIRIVLKAKDHEPLKLMTREDTTVKMIVEAFRTQRDVGPEWEVAIWFDGERLDEDSLVMDADIDPDEANQFEVHVKRIGGRD